MNTTTHTVGHLGSVSTLALAAAIAFAVTACDQKPATPPPAERTPPPTTPPTTPAPKADNTKNNAPDRDGVTKTPMDQSNAPGDIEITAAIRRAIMDDKTMSVNAQNCKVICEKGAVTLRGVVDSQAEKDAVGIKAKAPTGVVSVDNQLEVKAP